MYFDQEKSALHNVGWSKTYFFEFFQLFQSNALKRRKTVKRSIKLSLVTRSSHGGLEAEKWTDNRTLSISVGLNPARHQNDFRSSSNTMRCALIHNVQKLTRLSSLDY